MPASSSASSTPGLLLSQYKRALRLSRVPQFKRHAIRRIHLEEVVDALSEQAAFQTLPQHIRGKNIRHLL
jgi:hypothetical protein